MPFFPEQRFIEPDVEVPCGGSGSSTLWTFSDLLLHASAMWPDPPQEWQVYFLYLNCDMDDQIFNSSSMLKCCYVTCWRKIWLALTLARRLGTSNWTGASAVSFSEFFTRVQPSSENTATSFSVALRLRVFFCVCSEVRTKMTKGQYSPVQFKNTWLLTICMETVHMAKSWPRKNQSQCSDSSPECLTILYP